MCYVFGVISGEWKMLMYEDRWRVGFVVRLIGMQFLVRGIGNEFFSSLLFLLAMFFLFFKIKETGFPLFNKFRRIEDVNKLSYLAHWKFLFR